MKIELCSNCPLTKTFNQRQCARFIIPEESRFITKYQTTRTHIGAQNYSYPSFIKCKIERVSG